MSSSTKSVERYTHSLTELAEILVKHHDLHEGFYEIAFELQVGIGSVGQDDQRLPGAAIGVKTVGLTRIDRLAPMSVDASKVNPAKKPKRIVSGRGD
ncbi:hypothetical protein C7T35_25115 [Variovorax sp. WS11]|uniref:hypothetical protein n=1 Tax=Variovorax sp. WS11 TaxID=1105204 RepID=UPI000D0CFA5D|nr:hypothetical protein [Variovorax sp. WS11]NDZ15371.1 hypothetical protein [Variovorax sp. WS11]PSL81796.1 hypothetical protein C7T35_25115 [Variovorax sp. WS11]